MTPAPVAFTTTAAVPDTFRSLESPAAQAATTAEVPDYGWRPFVTVAPMWEAWWVLLIPLLVAIAVIYKATKSPTARRLPWEATKLTAAMLGFLAAAAAVLLVGVRWLL